MKLTANTPTKWAQFRAIMGLPGSTRVKDVQQVMDNTALARFFFSQTENGRAASTAKTGGSNVQVR